MSGLSLWATGAQSFWNSLRGRGNMPWNCNPGGQEGGVSTPQMRVTQKNMNSWHLHPPQKGSRKLPQPENVLRGKVEEASAAQEVAPGPPWEGQRLWQGPPTRMEGAWARC